jgi:Fe-Mn family superoxide dismutase
VPYNSYPFELPPLQYEYDALEPYIDAETMYIHHDKHFQSYINNLNQAIEPFPNLQELTLEQLLTWTRFLPQDIYTKIMQNGGGVYNHRLFFRSLAPAGSPGTEPSAALLADIEKSFYSFSNFKALFTEEALKVFGSGWTYLIYTRQGGLKIVSMKNQDTPLALKAVPVMLMDVWEHAYYLKYKNARAAYIDALWNVVRFSDD